MAMKIYVDYDSLNDILKPINESIKNIETLLEGEWKDTDIKVPEDATVEKVPLVSAPTFKIGD